MRWNQILNLEEAINIRLVITEKPSVARNIAEVLHATKQRNGYLQGDDYLVSWCIGHLVELVSADMYREEWKDWKYETLPIIPDAWKYQVKENTKRQYQVLEQLLHDPKISEVICATDAGREGELIFRLVYEQAGCSKPVKRLWISSMEEKVIREGFQDLRDAREYDNLYSSAVCHSVADWLVGINATRLFSVLYRHKLTVGRVQTPTLAMLVERERSISDFKKEKYFVVHILGDGMDAVSERISDKRMAEQIKDACQGEPAEVRSVVTEEKVIHSPKLYDLTTLQRNANSLFGFTAQQTLDYAQSLYEKKLVTYPRTDSRYLTEDMGEGILEIIEDSRTVLPLLRGFEHLSEILRAWREKSYAPDINKVINNKKVSDHHAIIPTAEIGKANMDQIPGGEKQILLLIALHLICATEEDHVYETVKVKISCNGESFTASGKRVLKNGWKDFEELFLKEYQNDQKQAEECQNPLPVFLEGRTFAVTSKVTEHDTAPPKHYTEDTLLAAMERAGNKDLTEDAERKGLGTPSTRAAIIEKLVEKGFVQRKGKHLLPTEDGTRLIAVLPDVVKSPRLTAEWENDLTLIARGEQSEDEFLADIEALVRNLVQTYREPDQRYRGMFGGTREEIGKCPKCGEAVFAGKGNFYCGNRECDFVLFQNNSYFASMKKELTKQMVQAFLQKGEAKVDGLYSKKKGSTFSALIRMDVSGKYPQFTMEFPQKKKSGKPTNKKQRVR